MTKKKQKKQKKEDKKEDPKVGPFPEKQWKKADFMRKPETEEEPCLDCLEETTGSFVPSVTTEDIKTQEAKLKQELSVRQAEHQYQVARDVKLINALIVIARRLGAIEHLQRRHLDVDLEYLKFVKFNRGKGGVPTHRRQESLFDSVYESIPKNIRPQLIFTDGQDGVRIHPKTFLGPDTWKEVMQIIKSRGGEWISAGKNSYWVVGG